MSELIACIPNFSEARRPEVVHAIVKAMTTVPGVRVLDVSSALDHLYEAAVTHPQACLVSDTRSEGWARCLTARGVWHAPCLPVQ
ncbi:MAG: hypothetical protein HOP18_28430 [Deltaproteobacteria bacterium]|nr:hypothetical protein [Deltaproteobacteria bacterium]